MEFNIPPTLVAVFREGFSETAGSGPAHHEARRHRLELAPLAILRGRDADDLAKRATERSQAAEADVQANVGHTALGLTQQEHRTFDAPPLQIAVRRLAECLFEGADEVRLGDDGDAGQVRNVERLRIGAVHRIARPQHASVALFDRPTHQAQLDHVRTSSIRPGSTCMRPRMGTATWSAREPGPGQLTTSTRFIRLAVRTRLLQSPGFTSKP